MSCLYVFSSCCPLLCTFSLFFIVIEGLLILLSICIIYDKACRIIFRSITFPCKPYSRGAQNSVLLRNAWGYTDYISNNRWSLGVSAGYILFFHPIPYYLCVCFCQNC